MLGETFQDEGKKMMKKFFDSNETPRVVVAVDPSDTDNLELAIGALRWFGPDNTHILLTGRAAMDPRIVKKLAEEIGARGGNPIREIPITEWSAEFSEVLLQASALRFKKLLRLFDCTDQPIFHGGIAAKPKVPHAIHMDDLFGFGDITGEDVGEIEKGLVYTDAQETLAASLNEKPFVVFLGGPATGVEQLLRSYPHLYQGLRGVFAQYASLGNVKGMQWDGRSERAQFNVMLDAVAGKNLCGEITEKNIPLFFLPTDVTRRNEIGFGVPDMVEGILRMSPGIQELARQRRKWYEAAIRTRNGEVLLTHDMSTLFLYLQLQGELPKVYETSPAIITEFTTGGPDEGAIELDLDVSESNLAVATKLINRDAYIDVLRSSLQPHSFAQKHIVICGSIESDAPEKESLAYAQKVLEVVSLHLRQGHIVHFGSHPSMQSIMSLLAQNYPTQLHQYLIERFQESRITALPDNHVHIFATLVEMRKSMLEDKNVGVFLRGRTDMGNTVEGFSGVLLEYLAFQIANPNGLIERHIELGGATLLVAAMESVAVLQQCMAKSAVLRKQYGSLLQSY